jgi:hypothetical protein
MLKLLTVSTLPIALVMAASPSDEGELPPAEAVLDRHVEVTGGKEARLARSTRKRTGTLRVDMGGHKFEAKIEEHSLAPDKSHVVYDGDSFFQVQVCDGVSAWEWRAGHADSNRDAGADSGVTTLMEGTTKARAIRAARFYAPVEWRSIHASVETLGIADVKGKPAYEVRITSSSEEQYSQFYDVESGRLVRRVRKAPGHGGEEIDMDVFIEDYREFDGVWSPMTIHADLKSPNFGEGTQIWTYTNVEYDLKVPASLFEMPEELRESASEDAD